MSTHKTLLCRYHYDPLDRLAGHAAADDADTRLFYQKSRLATQVQGVLSRSVMQFDDQLLAQQQSSVKAAEVTLLATDPQRSVLQALGGGQHQALAYTAYGYLPMSSGLSSLLGFDGERRELVTGHYLLGNGYRAFSPILMRFNSPDSLSPFDEGGLNAYAYCQGDPVSYRDPTGHIKSFILLAWDARSHVLRPVSRLNRSITALQLPRGMVSPPSSVLDVSMSEGQAVLDKASVAVKTRSLPTPASKVSKAKKLPSRLGVRHNKAERQTMSRVMEKPKEVSYWREDFRESELGDFFGFQQPGASFTKIESVHVLSLDEATVAAKAVRS